jgi:hypothetical protein
VGIIYWGTVLKWIGRVLAFIFIVLPGSYYFTPGIESRGSLLLAFSLYALMWIAEKTAILQIKIRDRRGP